MKKKRKNDKVADSEVPIKHAASRAFADSTIIVPQKDLEEFESTIGKLREKLSDERKKGKDTFSADMLERHLASQFTLLKESANGPLYQDVVKNIKRLTQQIESLEKEESEDIRKSFYDRSKE